MRKLWWLLVAWCLSGCAFIPTDYKGPDGGQVFVGIGVRGYTKFDRISLLFRRVGQAEPVARFTYAYRGPFFSGERPDYKFDTHEERGVAVVASLPPGDYELHNVEFFWAPGSFSFKQPMSVPFTVKAGTAVYLGNYQFTELNGKNLLRFSVPTGGFFAVEDRLADELPMALNKGLSPRATVVNATPDPARVRHPMLMSPAQRQRVAAELNLEE